ncbi:MAG: PKD domain-containing protein, partial [Bradymonadales bacterium]|nr:PKD domain-containing protein [Bradymonadales bacterium]
MNKVKWRLEGNRAHRSVVISLALWMLAGCSEDLEPPAVVPEVSVSADWDDPLGLSPLTVSFGCVSVKGEQPFGYSWSFGDGVTSTLQNPTYTYSNAGTYQATCTVIYSNGNIGQDSILVPVVLDTAPQVLISANPMVGFAGLEVHFDSRVTQGNGTMSYLWEFGDGATATTLPAATHTYTSPGIFQAILTVEDQDGDVGIAVVQVVVGTNSQPVVVAWGAPSSGVSPLQVQFNSEVVGGDGPFAYLWDFAGQGTSSYANPMFEYR